MAWRRFSKTRNIFHCSGDKQKIYGTASLAWPQKRIRGKKVLSHSPFIFVNYWPSSKYAFVEEANEEKTGEGETLVSQSHSLCISFFPPLSKDLLSSICCVPTSAWKSCGSGIGIAPFWPTAPGEPLEDHLVSEEWVPGALVHWPCPSKLIEQLFYQAACEVNLVSFIGFIPTSTYWSRCMLSSQSLCSL